MKAENTLWMGDIEPLMTESTIINSFQYFNFYPEAVKLIKDKINKKNKEYCFVTFKTIQEAKNALINLNGIKLPLANINFKLNWAESQKLPSKTKTIYVGNLNSKIGDNELFKLFNQKYKSVHSANVINDNGKSKGYGFVVFKNEEDYIRSLKEMNGYNFYGHNIRVREKKLKDEEHKNKNNKNNNNMNHFEENSNNQKNKNHFYKLNNERNNNNLLSNIKNNNDKNIPFNIINNINYINNNIQINKLNNNNNNLNLNSNFLKDLIQENTFLNNNNISNNINSTNNIMNLISKDNIIINNNENIPNDTILNNIVNNNNYNQLALINNLLSKINSSIPNNQNNKTLIYENNKKDNNNFLINLYNNISNINNESKLNININKNENHNYTINNLNLKIDKEKTNKNNNNINKPKNNKNKKLRKNQYKLEILDNIDEATLAKKIHESILRTFEYHKKLSIDNGLKFKSKQLI